MLCAKCFVSDFLLHGCLLADRFALVSREDLFTNKVGTGFMLTLNTKVEVTLQRIKSEIRKEMSGKIKVYITTDKEEI